MSEATAEGGSGPSLVLPPQPGVYKVGDRINLTLTNIPHGEELAEYQISSTPPGLDIVGSKLLDNERTKHFTLIPTKYGSFKVTMTSLQDCPPVFINVCPLTQLERRVTGSPGVELPRDLLVNTDHFIVSDGVRKQVIKINHTGSQEVFEKPENIQNAFSPIGLALKQDLASEDNNEVYVTDLNNACVHVYHGLRYLESFGKGVLKRPTGIAIDDDGFVFVGDYDEKKIFQFSPDFEQVEEEMPHTLEGPELMTIHKPTTSGATGSTNLLVADRRGSKISVFTIEKDTAESGKLLNWVHDIKMGFSPGQVLPFSVACDESNHIFVAGQLDENGEKRGFVWFLDGNSLKFGGSHKMEDWRFGDGMRNPGGLRIVSRNGGNTFLCVSDMRGKNAKSCINEFLLKR